MMKITKLEFALVSAIVIIIASACFYCWPLKTTKKTESVGAPVQKIEVSIKTQKTYPVTGQVGLSLEK